MLCERGRHWDERDAVAWRGAELTCSPSAPQIFFQGVAEEETGQNRLYLDLRLPVDVLHDELRTRLTNTTTALSAPADGA